MAGFFTRTHRYTTTALKLRRFVASSFSECGCSFPSVFFGVAALSVFAFLFGGAFLSFLECGWWLSLRFFAHPSLSWWCCLFLSLCVVRLGWCCISSSSVWVVLRSLFLLVGGAFSLHSWVALTPVLQHHRCGRSTTSKKEDDPPLSTPTIEPEATQSGHIGRASPCEDRPLNGVCVRSKFACGIVGAVSVHGVSGNNADFKGGSCAGGFVRVRWRSLVVAGSQTL